MSKSTISFISFFYSLVSLFLSIYNINGVFFDDPETIDYDSAKHVFVYSNSVVKNIGKDSYNVIQGGCTDGTYAYYSILSKANNCCSIIKYRIDTWEEVARKDNVPIDHGNDMTYNKDLDCLVVCNSAPNKDVVSFVDKDTLTVTKTVKIPLEIHSISYNASTKQYVVGISLGFKFAFLDKNFKITKVVNGVKPESTARQGMDSDEKYIYFIYSDPNIISVYDWNGKHQGFVQLDDIAQEFESENIFHIGNSFYIGYNYKHGSVYKTSFKAIY